MKRAMAGLLVGLLMTGCATAPRKPDLSAVQLREMQTRDYEKQDAKKVLKALVGTLQDEGYVVKESNVDLGIVTAERQTQKDDTAATADHKVSVGAIVLGILAIGAITAGAIAVSNNSSSHHRNNAVSAPAPVQAEPESRDQTFFVTVFTGNVSEVGSLTRLRSSFERRTLDQKGNLMQVETVQDPTYFQTFFSKVDKGLFLTTEGV